MKNDYIYCPRCKNLIKAYTDSGGVHYTCPRCGRNDRNYTLEYRDGCLRELPYEEENEDE